jgi:hypothetical protein
MMILVRDVFQAKYGRGGELVALFKELSQIAPQYDFRILTDMSGTFFTIVTEEEVESLGEWERITAELFNTPGFDDWFARMIPLVESGKREFYHIVD